MVIAALVVFGALLAAWLLAPAESARTDRSAAPLPGDVAQPLAEGLAEAA
jgi:hypothetical protein